MAEKIKLLNDVFADDSGLVEGMVVETVQAPRLLEKPKGVEKWVKGRNGDEYRVFEHEFEVVPEE